MKRLLAYLCAGALFAAGCSSGSSQEGRHETPPETSAPKIEIVQDLTEPFSDHSLNYAPIKDAFSFENFGGGEAPADLTVNMARRLYGDTQVCSDVTDSQCTPYPVILQLISQANRSMMGGLCEGLAVLSLRLAGDAKTLAGFQNANTVAALVKEDPALLSELVYWYVTQFAIEVQEEASSYLQRHPAQLAEVLLRDFEAAEKGQPSTGYTIGIYSDEGGHAVTPYRVEEVEGGYRIYIYDSNWPTEERWIDVGGDGWTYALAATNPTEAATAWSGSTGTMELTPMRSRSGPFTCSFCPSDGESESGTMLTVASSGSKQMSIKIETESGQRLGYYDGKFVNEIPGATYRYLISGPSTADPVLVFLPPGIETFDANVEEIKLPAPTGESEGLETQQPEQAKESIDELEDQQQYSLLLLNEEKSIQIEAAIQEEPEPVEGTGAPMSPLQPEPEIPTASLISFSDTGIEIAEVEDATVAIAIDSLQVEIPLDKGQAIEVVIAPDPEPLPDTDGGTQVPPPTMLDIAIADDTGEVVAEVEVDLSDYLVEEEEPEDQGVTPPLPEEPEEEIAPVTIQIIFDEEAGEVTLEEEEVEAWVASDAEYYQAIIDDNLEEVLGESYAEEILEREDWEMEWEDEIEEELEWDLREILESVDEEYWEDEIWDEVEYDDEWFEEEFETQITFFAEVEDIDDWFEEEAWVPEEEWVEDWEDEEWFEEWEDEEWFETLEEEWEDEWEEPEFELEEEPFNPFEMDEWEDEEPLWDNRPPMEQTWEEEEIEVEWEELPDEDFIFDFGLEDFDELEIEVWEIDPFLDTEEEWDEWEEEFWPEDMEWEDEWAEEEEEDVFPELDLGWLLDIDEEEWDEEWGPHPTTTLGWTEEDWDEYYEEDEWEGDLDEQDWQTDIDEGIEPEEPEGISDEEPESEPDLPPETEVDEEQVDEEELPIEEIEPEPEPEPELPPPPPPPVYWYDEATSTWDEEGNTVLSSNTVGTTTESTTTSVLARGTDGHWYETLTTETTTTTQSQAVSTVHFTTYSNTVWCGGTQYDSSCGSTGAVAGNTFTTVSTGATTNNAVVTTATEVVPASCSQGGFTGLGDWCIVDSNSRNDYDYVAFSVPTAAEENEACDCTDGDGLMDIRIDAESNLTRAQFGSNNEHADPYIYLNHDTDSDDGDHSGDTSEITVGDSIEHDDDHGRDCGNTSQCTNPPSTATDPDETPNVTLANGDPVIENVSDQWDARIERELPAGDYVIRGSVYNNANSGWYRLTIRDADVTYPPEENTTNSENSA